MSALLDNDRVGTRCKYKFRRLPRQPVECLPGCPRVLCASWEVFVSTDVKGALYRIWCGVNRLGDSVVKVV